MLNTLNNYYEKGLLTKQTNPDYPELTIWNYTPEVQYSGEWDEITLMCRGLVTDDNGDIIARPFKKFFNLEENRHNPTQNFEVFEKMDGSLIIAFYYQGWQIASRGSFTSDQALAARKLFNQLDTSTIPYSATLMFEYISKWNRIVVDYGDIEKLVLLGAIRTEDGTEAPYESLEFIAKSAGCEVVPKYDGIVDYNTLKNKIDNNAEGFVVRFTNGERIKIKGEEYLRLHKIMTNLSTTAIWEVLSKGESMETILVDVPDEFYNKIKAYEVELMEQYAKLVRRASEAYQIMNVTINVEYRRDAALFIKAQDKVLQPILFKMLDGKDYSQYVWKVIKPEFEKL